MATNNIRFEFLSLSDDEVKSLIREREEFRIMEEQEKARVGEYKASLAAACSKLHIIGALPDWIDVKAATDKKGTVNFYRALKVPKPK